MADKPVLGKKYDEHKPMYHLLPWEQVEKVVRVLTFGANKYVEDDWKYFVSKAQNQHRYFSAALRHLSAWKQGKDFDSETKIEHLAHAVCCILFLMWRDDEDKISNSKYRQVKTSNISCRNKSRKTWKKSTSPNLDGSKRGEFSPSGESRR